MILAQKQRQYQEMGLKGKALFHLGSGWLLFTMFPSVCSEGPGHWSENPGFRRASITTPYLWVMSSLLKPTPWLPITERSNLRRPRLPTLSSWPRFGLHSVIGSYYCYYGYNYRSLIYSLKMLHLFHFALFFYWRIKFLWEILLIGWIRCHPCSLQAGCTCKQCQAGLPSGSALQCLLSLSLS